MRRGTGRTLFTTSVAAWLIAFGPVVSQYGGLEGGPVSLDVPPQVAAASDETAPVMTLSPSQDAEGYPAFRTYPVATPAEVAPAPPASAPLGAPAHDDEEGAVVALDATRSSPSAQRSVDEPTETHRTSPPVEQPADKPSGANRDHPPAADPADASEPPVSDASDLDRRPGRTPPVDVDPPGSPDGPSAPDSDKRDAGEAPDDVETPELPDADDEPTPPLEPEPEPEPEPDPQPQPDGLGPDGLRARIEEVHAAWNAREVPEDEVAPARAAAAAGLWWALVESCVGSEPATAPACADPVAEAFRRLEIEHPEPGSWGTLAAADRDAGYVLGLRALGRLEPGASPTSPAALPEWAR